MTLDEISEKRLSLVCPALAVKIRQMAAEAEFPFRVTQGLRTWNEQRVLWEVGRDSEGRETGPIVTKARPGHSWHNFGLAVDLVPLTTLSPDWNTSHPQWQRLLQLGQNAGLVEGAHFRTFPDYPHFQLTGTWPDSPNDEVRLLFEQAGMEAVWKEGGLI